MVRDTTDIQKVCHLEGTCLKDAQMIVHLAQRMEKATAAGDWDANMKGLEAL